MNLVRWRQRAFGVTPGDRATQIAAVGFDAAVWELWPYLTAGASVHMPSDVVRKDIGALREWLIGDRITVSFLATPLAEEMLGLPWPQNTALRFLLTGADTLRRYPAGNLPFALVNNYGPTECTVVATSGVVRHERTPFGCRQSAARSMVSAPTCLTTAWSPFPPAATASCMSAARVSSRLSKRACADGGAVRAGSVRR